MVTDNVISRVDVFASLGCHLGFPELNGCLVVFLEADRLLHLDQSFFRTITIQTTLFSVSASVQYFVSAEDCDDTPGCNSDL